MASGFNTLKIKFLYLFEPLDEMKDFDLKIWESHIL